MEHYGELKNVTISGIPQDLIEKYDYIAKHLAGNRSIMMRLQMENLIRNCQIFYAKEATTQQLAQFATDETFRFFGMDLPKMKNNLENNLTNLKY